MSQPIAPTLRSRDAAQRLGISAELVRKLAAEGKLRSLRLPSGHRRYYEADVDRFIADHVSDEGAA